MTTLWVRNQWEKDHRFHAWWQKTFGTWWWLVLLDETMVGPMSRRRAQRWADANPPPPSPVRAFVWHVGFPEGYR